MTEKILYKEYFADGTVGIKIIKKFYFSHHRLLVQNNYTDLNDLVHDIYIKLARIDFSKIQNPQNYIHRAIKIQCWAILESICNKKTTITAETRLSSGDASTNILSETPAEELDPHSVMEFSQLIAGVLKFKSFLPDDDAKILNAIIDENDISMIEISKRLNLNENTVRTKVRRIRAAFFDYLVKNGYLHD